MTLDLEAIKARVDAATPGPWECGPAGFDRRRTMIGAAVTAGPIVGFLNIEHIQRDRKENAAFITAAREDVPALVSAVEAVLAVHFATRDRQDAPYYCDEDGQPWPCKTARACGSSDE